MDEAVLRALNAWAASPVVAATGVFLSSAWLLATVTVPLGVYLLSKRRFAAMLTIALAMASADAVNARILKPLVARDRPCRALVGLELPARCGAGKSFASSHAATAFAFVLTAAPEVPFGWALFVPVGGLVAGSRVLLGQHYPSDVVAGGLVGVLVGLGAARARRRLTRGPSAGADAHGPRG